MVLPNSESLMRTSFDVMFKSRKNASHIITEDYGSFSAAGIFLSVIQIRVSETYSRISANFTR
jgi:hypothetical protein